MQSPDSRPSWFPLTVSTLLTAYLAVAAFFLGREALSPADHAVQHLLWVLVGAGALVTFCLFVRVLDEEQARRRTDD